MKMNLWKSVCIAICAAGVFSGNAETSFIKASVPPVEAPIAIRRTAPGAGAAAGGEVSVFLAWPAFFND